MRRVCSHSRSRSHSPYRIACRIGNVRAPVAPQIQTKLYISDTNCVKFDVPAQVGDSIKTVKGYIQVQTGIPFDQLELRWGGYQLEDHRTLTDILITLDLNVVFCINVRKLSGQEWTVAVEANESVVALKTKIQRELNIPRCQQKLVFDTTVLDNHRPISYYGVQVSSVVTLVCEAVELSFEILGRSRFSLKLMSNDSIDTLMAEIQKITNIAPEEQEIKLYVDCSLRWVEVHTLSREISLAEAELFDGCGLWVRHWSDSD